jgi:hypothetical protein
MPNDNNNNNYSPISPMEDVFIPPSVNGSNYTENQTDQKSSEMSSPFLTAEAPTNQNTPPELDKKNQRKKFIKNRIIPTVLVLLLLAGGTATGVFLVQQQQDIREKANEVPTLPYNSPAACQTAGGFWCAGCGGFCLDPKYKGGGCNQAIAEKCGGSTDLGGVSCIKYEPSSEEDIRKYFKRCDCHDDNNRYWGSFYFDKNGICDQKEANDKGLKGQDYNRVGLCAVAAKGCKGPLKNEGNPPQIQCWTWTDNGVTITNDENCNNCYAHKHTCNFNTNTSQGCNTTNPEIGKSAYFDGKCGQTQQIDVVCGTDTKGFKSRIYPNCTDTPSETTAQCSQVKAFDENWKELSLSELSKKKPGEKIRFTVSGNASSGSFDKALFIINGTQTPEVTQKKPGTNNEFYYEYTIPQNVSSIRVEAKVHHTTLGWSK